MSFFTRLPCIFPLHPLLVWHIHAFAVMVQVQALFVNVLFIRCLAAIFRDESSDVVPTHKFSIDQILTIITKIIDVILIWFMMSMWLCYVPTCYVLNCYFEVGSHKLVFLVVHFEEFPCNNFFHILCCDLHAHSISDLFLQQPRRMISSFDNLGCITLWENPSLNCITICNMYACLKFVYSWCLPRNCPVHGRHPVWIRRSNWGTFWHAYGHCQNQFTQTCMMHSYIVFIPI